MLRCEMFLHLHTSMMLSNLLLALGWGWVGWGGCDNVFGSWHKDYTLCIAMLWDLLLHLLTDIIPRHQILCDNVLWLLAQGLYATQWRRDDDDDDDDADDDGGGVGGGPFAWKITWCPWAAPGILAKGRRLQLADVSFRDKQKMVKKNKNI